MMLKLYIGEDVMDLFQDESIEINSSIANVNDITKNTTDYAKSFTVPASHTNNRIFKHYYDANIDNAFDARVKVSGRIEFDGIPFRYGKWSLEKVQLKQGKPYAYSINFVGNLVSLKDKLKNDELSSLDFTSLDHSYNSETVKTGLGAGLFDGKVIYNLLVKKQLYYNSTSTEPNVSDKSINIAYNGISYSELRPSIKLLSIIEAIENDYNIVFSRDFFGTTEFANLYLWLNADKVADVGGGTKVINWDSGDADNINLLTNLGYFETSLTGSLNSKTWNLILSVTPDDAYITVPYTIRVYANGEVIAKKTINPVGGVANVGVLSVTLQSEIEGSKDWDVYWEVESGFEFQYTAGVMQQEITQEIFFPYDTITTTFNTYASIDTISSTGGISKNMPKIKIIDFLKGLFSMFKLVVISDDNENLYVDTIDNYYALGNVWNVSRYVKTDTLEVSRGNLLNELNFKFKEPITIINNQFKKLNGLGYGDTQTYLTDNGTKTGRPLEGEPLTIEIPFEQIVYERLPDLADGLITNIQYGAIVDDKLEPANPAPHIFYNIKENVLSKPFIYLIENDIKSTYNGILNTPSHVNSNDVQIYSSIFSSEFNEWDGNLIENTLYSNHYKNYVESIFNVKRRSFKYSAVLPLRILLQLQLNDILEIKNNYYRIDNFNLNLLTRDISLNLINAFDLVIAGFTSDVNSLFADYLPQTQSISIPNIGNSTIAIDDDTWLDATIVGTIVYFDFEQNNTGLTRFNNATITNTDTLQTINIFVTQYGTTVTADNGTITADSNLITADNG